MGAMAGRLEARKVIDIVFVAVLALSAALQINDPDPVYWVAVYAVGALVPLLHCFGRDAPFLAGLTIGMILTGMMYAGPGFVDYLESGDFRSITSSMDGSARYVEPAREFLGLLIALAIVGSYPIRRWTG